MLHGESFWSATAPDAHLEGTEGGQGLEGEFDCAVVGGGIAGVTLAHALAREGRRVVLIERGRVGHGDTAFTTAHLTAITDTALHDLARRFGRETAREAWLAGERAIATI